MDSAWFYDSNFHLNTAGSTVNTVRLAEDVLAWLGCWSPVEILLPAMPESAAAAAAPGGDGEAFTYTPVADGAGWMVSGVTAAGAEASVLTVPSAHEGRPVVGLTGDALREAAALEELRLPQTVATIPEGLLAGCPTLRRLVLEHTDAPCGLAAHALEGADRVRIYVPAAAWPMYRDGYGCEANPWAPWLDRIYTY